MKEKNIAIEQARRYRLLADMLVRRAVQRVEWAREGIHSEGNVALAERWFEEAVQYEVLAITHERIAKHM